MILAITDRGEDLVEVYDGRSTSSYSFTELYQLCNALEDFLITRQDYKSQDYLAQEALLRERRNPPEKSLNALLGIFKPAVSALRIPRIK